MKVLIDNGHGAGTPGKCSPDRRLREFAYVRKIASGIVKKLKEKGVDALRLVPEEDDIPLPVRVERVNEYCKRWGNSNVMLVSIHVNASGNDDRWHEASGWTSWVCNGASERSRKLARKLYDNAEKRGLRGNRHVPVCKYWEADYYILKKTNCPAVLTENMFQDNLKDVDYLLSEKGKSEIVELHVESILYNLK